MPFHHEPISARSWLFAPGDSEKKMTKAMEGAADIVLIDLEDAVAPESKVAARAMVHDFIKANAAQRQRLWVRINPFDGPYTLGDLAAVMPANPGGIMLPKVYGRADVDKLDHCLSALEVANGIEEGSTPVIVLVTDGEQRVDDVSLSDAAEFLKARDVRLYAIAAGRTHRGFAADLRAAAERTGGRGYLARDEAALERICSEIDALEKSESTVRRFTPSWPRHREVLLGALAAFVFQLVLGSFALAGTRRLSVAEAHAALETGGSR